MFCHLALYALLQATALEATLPACGILLQLVPSTKQAQVAALYAGWWGPSVMEQVSAALEHGILELHQSGNLEAAA